MHHRGPDNYGVFQIPGELVFSHLRLAILDLNPESNQPFHSEDDQYVLVFNGEIYNYLELRQELKQEGIGFSTQSDTEVLLKAYIHWGNECVKKFNGDWAFVIYDKNSKITFGSRDRYGVKPFNFYKSKDEFIFSSEIKSILALKPELRVPNKNAILNFCKNSLGAENHETWFQNIFRLPPGTFFTLKGDDLKIESYWQYEQSPKFSENNYKEVEKGYLEQFENAVKIRTRTDVPFGTTLSSGIDSTSIASFINKFRFGGHKTYTAVFNQERFSSKDKGLYKGETEINEGDIVKRFTKEMNLDCNLVDSHSSDFIETLTSNIYHLESGNSSPATIPLSNLLKRAKEDVTVVLEGQGSDELLAGYSFSMFPYALWDLIKKGRIKQAWREILEIKANYSFLYVIKLFFRSLNIPIVEHFYHRMTGVDRAFSKDSLRTYTRVVPNLPKMKKASTFDKKRVEAHMNGLVNLLHYGDAISMAHSLESRNPFCDVDLVSYSMRLPQTFLYHEGMGKYIHRKAMLGIVPDYILNNKVKFGFATPLSEVFSSWEDPAVKILNSDSFKKREIFDYRGVANLLQQQIEGEKSWGSILFRILSVELWYRQFIDKRLEAF
jgi:asparagine synthase (glutamine-hydrolysing)